MLWVVMVSRSHRGDLNGTVRVNLGRLTKPGVWGRFSETVSLKQTYELSSKTLPFKMWSVDDLSGHHLRAC